MRPLVTRQYKKKLDNNWAPRGKRFIKEKMQYKENRVFLKTFPQKIISIGRVY